MMNDTLFLSHHPYIW